MRFDNESAVIARTNTRFATKAATTMNAHRTKRRRTHGRGDGLLVRLACWTFVSLVVGFVTGCAAAAITEALTTTSVANVAFGGTMLISACLPTLVWAAARRATDEVPAQLREEFTNAAGRIEALTGHDATAADRLRTELLAYVDAAHHAVELDNSGQYAALREEWELLTADRWMVRSYDVKSDERLLQRARRVDEVAKQIAAIPSKQVAQAIRDIGTTADETIRVLEEKARFADAPRRELEAQIRREREQQRLENATHAFTDAMNHAQSLSAVHSEDLREDASIARKAIAQLN